MGYIEVTRPSVDRLSDEVWRFNLSTRLGLSDEVTMFLTFYARRSRPTTRHKMAVEAKWNNKRSYWSSIKAEDVPLPEDVRAEAMLRVVVKIEGARP